MERNKITLSKCVYMYVEYRQIFINLQLGTVKMKEKKKKKLTKSEAASKLN